MINILRIYVIYVILDLNNGIGLDNYDNFLFILRFMVIILLLNISIYI